MPHITLKELVIKKIMNRSFFFFKIKSQFFIKYKITLIRFVFRFSQSSEIALES